MHKIIFRLSFIFSLNSCQIHVRSFPANKNVIFSKMIISEYLNLLQHIFDLRIRYNIVFLVTDGVTRFGEISPLWQIVFGHFLRVHLILGKFSNLLRQSIFYGLGKIFIVRNVLTLNNYCSNLVTLLCYFCAKLI